MISFTLSCESRNKGKVSKFYRGLYGYESYLRYGKYRSKKDGFLNGVRNIRYSKGLFVIRKEDQGGKAVSYLRKRGASVVLWEVVPNRREKKLVELQVT